MAYGELVINMELNTKEFDAQIDYVKGQMEDIEEKLRQADMGFEVGDTQKLEAQYERLSNKLKKLIKEKEEFNKTDMSGLIKSLGNVGNSVEGVVKKITRWGLAVLGIRSAYMFIRQEMSALSGYNEKIGADIEYMRFSLATALQPVIEGIVKLLYKMLVYVAYILKVWFNVNIFANASTKAFEKANKNVKATNKSAKELQKTLAGFDEMNILQKNGSVGTGGGGGGVTLPSMDLSNWENIEVPGWIKWLAEHGALVRDILIGIGSAIAGIKLANFINGLGLTEQALTKFKTFLLGLGIAAIIYGVYKTIMSVIAMIKDPSWSNFINILQGLTITLTGVGIAMLAFNASNPTAWIITAIGAIGTFIISIGKFVSGLFDEQSQAEKTKIAIDNLKKAKEQLNNATNSYVNAVDNAEQAEKNLIELEKKHKISGKDLFDQVAKGILDYKNMNDKQREVYKAYLNNKDAQEKLKKSTKELKKANEDETIAELNKQSVIAKTKEDYEKLATAITQAYDTQKIDLQQATLLTLNAMADMDDATRGYFVEKLPQEILKSLDTSQYGKFFKDFKKWWNNNMQSLNGTITLKVNYQASGKGLAKGGIITSSVYKIPRLASGGLINQPGRGIPISSAIAGERGAEGVIPLTDSQQMALIGEAIGKYVTINLTSVTELDGRTIARKVQEVNNNTNFLLNR